MLPVLEEHKDCRPEWASLQRRESESTEAHTQRLKQLFPYRRTEAEKAESARRGLSNSHRAQSSRPQQQPAKARQSAPAKLASPQRGHVDTGMPLRLSAGRTSPPKAAPPQQKQPLQPRNHNSAVSPIRRYFKTVQPAAQPRAATSVPAAAKPQSKSATPPKRGSPPKKLPPKAPALALSPRQAKLAADQEAGKQ